YLNSIKDSFRAAADRWQGKDVGQYVGIEPGTEQPYQKAMSTSSFATTQGQRGFDVSPNSGLGRMIVFLGWSTGLSTRALGTQDPFFRSMAYRGEVWAQSWRQASREGLQQGTAGFNQRVAQLVADPPQNIKLAAADQALYSTFQNQVGPIGQWLMSGRRK